MLLQTVRFVSKYNNVPGKKQGCILAYKETRKRTVKCRLRNDSHLTWSQCVNSLWHNDAMYLGHHMFR